MANPNAPHGLQPVQNGDTSPYTGKSNLYHIPSSDTNAYYVGDVVLAANTGSDAQGVPDVILSGAGARGTPVTAALPVGVIVGIQVAPIGVGVGQTQGNAVNLNLQFVPATKLNDYYVWVADDPGLVMEIQYNNTGTLTPATTVGYNLGYTPTLPTAPSPVSGTVGSGLGTANTLPLKCLGLPYRPGTDFTANTPLLVTWNTHQYGKPSPGTTGV